ncbi:MAG TPA: hypothetical protein VMJ10_05010 [Kofleriaceae bacterium]|nr:hypothetical protein [Kofleriaceae bacterium]
MARRSSALLLVIALSSCKHESAPPAPANHDIPRATVPIVIDGEWTEPDWSKVSLRGQFLGSDGALARPSSEVRFLHDDKDLFVGLYAADENIQTSDAFELHVGALALRLDATGKVTPDTPGLRVALDRDGSLDDPKNNDEEWLLEVAIPLAATGLTPGHFVDVKASRCDVTKDGVNRCGSWSGALELAP